MWLPAVYLTVLFCAVLAADEGNYMVIVPSTVRIGYDTELNVRILHASGPVSIVATLKTSDKEPIQLRQESGVFNQGNSGILTLGKLSIDELPDTYASSKSQQLLLSVSGSGGGLEFEQEKEITLETKSLIIMVQTDKATYKPGQTVKFRTFAIKKDLKPHPGPFDIQIKDSQDNKIKQWLRQTGNTVNYVVSESMVLSQQPPLGDWKIIVKVGEEVGEKIFEVDEYVLPKFEVNVAFSKKPYHMVEMGDILFTVDAKYTFGKEVNGKADVMISYTDYYARGSIIQLSKELEAGKAEFKVTLEELSGMFKNYNGNRKERLATGSYQMEVVANVTEAGTKKVLDGKGTLPFKRLSLELSFLEATPDTFKPGLTYTAYMRLQQPDGNPPDYEQLHNRDGTKRQLKMVVETNFKRTTATGVTETGQRQREMMFEPQEDGILILEIPVDTDVDAMTLRPSFEDQYSTEKDERIINADIYSKTIQKFKSRDDLGIQVSMDNLESTIQADTTVTFKVISTEPINNYFFVMMSKGSIKVSNSIEKMTPFTEDEYEYEFTETLASQLAPSARIIVYYFTPSGELIVDTMDVNVDKSATFANDVSISFNKETVRPAEDLQLIVEASPYSYVGLLAVDVSVKLLKEGNDISQDEVDSELRQYDSSGKLRPVYPMFGGGWIDKKRKKRRSMPMPCLYRWGCFPIFAGGKDATELLQNAGLLVFSDAYIHEEPYDYVVEQDVVMEDDFEMMAGGVQNEAVNEATRDGDSSDDRQPNPTASLMPVTRTRNSFLETWIWANTTTGADGISSLTAQAPDTLTSFVASAFALSDVDGLGIAGSTAEVTVFKPFFVQLSLPYSLILEEEFILIATIFNYLSEEQEVLVTLSESDKFNVLTERSKVPVKQDATFTLKVAPNKEKVAKFWVVPKTLGQIELNVKAQSVGAADALIRKILVEPNGAPEEFSESMMINIAQGEEYSKDFPSFSIPDDAVEGSWFTRVTVIGDLMGNMVNNIDKLIRMPYGCGEQNMINFVPNINVRDYLESTGLGTLANKAQATTNMESGYQRELQYRRSDGSFSAFGERDPAGSTWLSAYVAKSFYAARDYIEVDDNIIASALGYIISQQEPNGEFAEQRPVIHKEMQGGASEGLPRTAYILLALLTSRNLDTQSSTLNIEQAISKARSYLESELDMIYKDPYTHAITTYALKQAGSSRYQEAYDKLMDKAIIEGDFKYWAESETKQEECMDYCWRRPATQDVEMTAYALMAMDLENNLNEAIPISKWMASKQTSNGGFSSTQNTVVGLQALTMFAKSMYTPGETKDVTVTIDLDGTEQHTFTPVTEDTTLLLQSFETKEKVEVIGVKATGAGIAMVQATYSYHVQKSTEDDSIELEVTSDKIDGVDEVQIHTCARWTKPEASGMVNIEFNSLSGYAIDLTTDLLDTHKGEGLMRAELEGTKLVTYWEQLSSDKKTCLTVTSFKENEVANIQKARVTAYNYYTPEKAQRDFYLPSSMAALISDRCKTCPECCGQEPITQGPGGGTGGGTGGGSTSIKSSWAVLLVLLAFTLLRWT